jgi:hypothetical protein
MFGESGELERKSRQRVTKAVLCIAGGGSDGGRRV